MIYGYLWMFILWTLHRDGHDVVETVSEKPPMTGNGVYHLVMVIQGYKEFFDYNDGYWDYLMLSSFIIIIIIILYYPMYYCFTHIKGFNHFTNVGVLPLLIHVADVAVSPAPGFPRFPDGRADRWLNGSYLNHGKVQSQIRRYQAKVKCGKMLLAQLASYTWTPINGATPH